MVVVYDSKAREVLEKFNLDIYHNIEGIVELLFAGFSIVGVNSVFITGSESRKLEFKCNDCDKRFQLMFEHRNEFYKECLILGDETKKMKYEIHYDKENSQYFLKLLGVKLNKDDNLTSEILFYRYGKHINVYYQNRVFSFDIQGSDSVVDFERFHKLLEATQKFDLEDLISKLQLCVVFESTSKILVDEYYNNQLIGSIAISEKGVARVRDLKIGKGKC